MDERVVLISKLKANIYSIVYLVLGAVLTAAFQFFIHKRLNWGTDVWWLLYLVAFIFIHEFLHGVGFRCWGKANWKDIKFGFLWKGLMPYCGCFSVLLTRRSYLISILLPTIVIGSITLIIAAAVPDAVWAAVMGVVISGGTGDFMMAQKILQQPKDARFRDHPSEPGFFVVC